MASLDAATKKAWKEALAGAREPWIVCGFDAAKQDALDGMVGLVDWMSHGQVSRLLQLGLGAGDATVIPGDPSRSRPSVLLYPVAEGAAGLVKKIAKLGVKELALAGSTFPEDFCAKVKQTLMKEGIRCTTLEP
jgi:hypothetical protein